MITKHSKVRHQQNNKGGVSFGEGEVLDVHPTTALVNFEDHQSPGGKNPVWVDLKCLTLIR